MLLCSCIVNALLICFCCFIVRVFHIKTSLGPIFIINVKISVTFPQKPEKLIRGNTKDKRMVYYAVAKGRCPGIYRKWDECQTQIRGFPGNAYRKRFCYDDAKRFLTRQGIRPQFDCGNFGDNIDRTKHFYYAVAIGREPGIYHTSWANCKDEVMHFSGREYRKYYCRKDARYFMERQCNEDEYPEYSDDDFQ